MLYKYGKNDYKYYKSSKKIIKNLQIFLKSVLNFVEGYCIMYAILKKDWNNTFMKVSKLHTDVKFSR